MGLVAVPEEEAVRLLDLLRERVEAEYPGQPSEATDAAIRVAVHLVVPDPPEGVTSEEMQHAVSVANIGYLFRKVEAEFVDADSNDDGDMTEALLALRESHPEWETWFAAVTGSAQICALGEGMTGDQTIQWKLPGVGAQARSMFVTSTVEGMAAPGGRALTPEHYRRCWSYGWYLRCFEDAMPPGAAF